MRSDLCCLGTFVFLDQPLTKPLCHSPQPPTWAMQPSLLWDECYIEIRLHRVRRSSRNVWTNWYRHVLVIHKTYVMPIFTMVPHSQQILDFLSRLKKSAIANNLLFSPSSALTEVQVTFYEKYTVNFISPCEISVLKYSKGRRGSKRGEYRCLQEVHFLWASPSFPGLYELIKSNCILPKL